jgi:hypothetical protein
MDYKIDKEIPDKRGRDSKERGSEKEDKAFKNNRNSLEKSTSSSYLSQSQNDIRISGNMDTRISVSTDTRISGSSCGFKITKNKSGKLY